MALALVYSLALVSLVSATGLGQRDAILQQLFAQLEADSTCQGAGHSGCCETSPCTSMDGSCYCDWFCHQFNDCCRDILAIGCFRSTRAPAQLPPPTSCLAAGFTSGCCTASSAADCFVAAGNCSCNESCHHEGNCCPDIEMINCPAPPLPNNCSASGYTSGCCMADDTGDCFVPAGNCSCAQSCHRVGNCCPDIANISCQAPQPTCSSIGVTAGCCIESTQDCRVPLPPESRPPTHCFCSVDCHRHEDCCIDIDAIGCHAELIPTNCTTAGHTNGCCSGGPNACTLQNGVCACDVGCYTEGNCCEDIQQINCFPHNCAEAGKLGCVVNPDEGEFCGITVAQGGECFCDANCNVSSYDCCEDALQGFPPSDQRELFLVNEMRMELARQMLYAEAQRRHHYYKLRQAMVMQRYSKD